MSRFVPGVPEVGDAVLFTSISGCNSIFTVHDSVSVTVSLEGSVDVTVAVFITRGMSDSVTICARVPPVLIPGPNVVVTSVTGPYLSSVTVMLVSVSSPVFVTLKQ